MHYFAPKSSGQMSESLITIIFITLSGGLQDAYTYLVRGSVFANGQTGNIVRMSCSVIEGDRAQFVHYFIPILFFIVGIFVCECVHRRFKDLSIVHWRQLIVAAEIILLFAVGFIPQSLNDLANALVSFVCAMQVQAFRKINGRIYATTMCIGNMRTATEELCIWAHTREKSSLRKALFYCGINGVFAVGAGLGAVVCRAFDNRGIWVCCALLLVSFALMFIKTSPRNGAIEI